MIWSKYITMVLMSAIVHNNVYYVDCCWKYILWERDFKCSFTFGWKYNSNELLFIYSDKYLLVIFETAIFILGTMMISVMAENIIISLGIMLI